MQRKAHRGKGRPLRKRSILTPDGLWIFDGEDKRVL